ncbi:MAG: hypothetical protein IJU16_08745 [Clostridia bacterium]|nr:hypothetical protein [Clostridia bacterium]
MQSKRIWAVWTAACLLFAGVWLAFCQSPVPALSPMSDAEQTAAAPYRVLGVWQEKIAVFLPDAAEPECVYDTPLSSLPAAEQERLRQGIAVEDRQQLRRLVEEYTS